LKSLENKVDLPWKIMETTVKFLYEPCIIYLLHDIRLPILIYTAVWAYLLCCCIYM